ncbi:MAG: hypothetical protein QM703_01995 [Gemmatales bacterium]
MKLRWHALGIAIATITGVLYWLWSLQPIWRVAGYEKAIHAGYSKATLEVRSLVVHKQDENWYLETRDSRDGSLLKEVKLDNLALQDTVTTVVNGATEKSFNAPLIVIVVKNDQFRTHEALMYDPQTGTQRESTSIPSEYFELPAISGDRAALITRHQLWLVDGSLNQIRKLNIPNVRAVRIAPGAKYLICRKSDGLYLLNWESDQLIKVYPNDEKTVWSDFDQFDFRFLNSGQLIMRRYAPGCRLSRWQWNGTALQQVAPELVIATSEWEVRAAQTMQLIFMEDEQQRMHFVSFAGMSWPREYRWPLIALSKMGVKVETWIPQVTVLLWNVVEGNHREVYRYEETIKQFRLTRLTNYLQISYGANQAPGKCIEMMSTAPRWPNVLAIMVVIYMLLYVFMLCRAVRSSGP